MIIFFKRVTFSHQPLHKELRYLFLLGFILVCGPSLEHFLNFSKTFWNGLFVHTHTHTHTHIHTYIYIYIYIYVCVCVFGQHFFINAYFIKLYWHLFIYTFLYISFRVAAMILLYPAGIGLWNSHNYLVTSKGHIIFAIYTPPPMMA